MNVDKHLYNHFQSLPPDHQKAMKYLMISIAILKTNLNDMFL
jgi:hypothetical protein